MESLVKIAAFNELQAAQAVAARLDAEGIAAVVHDESGQQKWQLWNLTPYAHLLVQVPGDHEDRARDLLKTWAAGDASSLGAVRCPECASFNIEYPQFSRKTLLGALPAAMATAGLVEKEFYCQDCHFTWPAEPPPPQPELDILNWPKKKPAN
jgi:hypothetical protein